jgi:hypothetical protein
MKRLLMTFLFDQHAPIMIDGTGLQPDPELVKRNQQRAQQAIAAMGPKYCCYRASNDDLAAENDMATYAAHSHNEG